MANFSLDLDGNPLRQGKNQEILRFEIALAGAVDILVYKFKLKKIYPKGEAIAFYRFSKFLS